jgi:hypothetical protein
MASAPYSFGLGFQRSKLQNHPAGVAERWLPGEAFAVGLVSAVKNTV